MNQNSSNERLMRILQASPEQLTAIDRVLDGMMEPARPERRGPFLLNMGNAASLMGVSRPTLWRMLNAGRLARVEVLPGTYRVRREEVEEIAFGQKAEIRKVESGNVELRHPGPLPDRGGEGEKVGNAENLKAK
jgi:excisionase family DNA binding protein